MYSGVRPQARASAGDVPCESTPPTLYGQMAICSLLQDIPQVGTSNLNRRIAMRPCAYSRIITWTPPLPGALSRQNARALATVNLSASDRAESWRSKSTMHR
jgi:hypothetical protein